MYGTRFHSGKKGIFQFSKLVKSNSEFGSDFRLTKKIMGQNSPPPPKKPFFLFLGWKIPRWECAAVKFSHRRTRISYRWTQAEIICYCCRHVQNLVYSNKVWHLIVIDTGCEYNRLFWTHTVSVGFTLGSCWTHTVSHLFLLDTLGFTFVPVGHTSFMTLCTLWKCVKICHYRTIFLLVTCMYCYNDTF